MLSLAEEAAQPRPNGAHGVWDVVIKVADVDAEMRASADAGVAIDRGPTTTEYEMKRSRSSIPTATASASGSRWSSVTSPRSR
jgi:hypothetical protein